MLKILKQSFFILKQNIIITQPLIIFLLILTFLITPLQSLKQSNWIFLIIINLALLTVAFISGWFGMIKQTIFNHKLQLTDKQTSLELLKKFFPSVGEYFLPTCLAGIVFIIINFIFAFATIKIGNYLFSDISVFIQMLQSTTKPIAEQKAFLEALSSGDLLLLNKWILFFIFSYFLTNILLLFYPAILFFKTKNPFKIAFYSVLCVFKKPLFAIGLCINLHIISFIVSAFSIIGNLNFILSMISLFITLIFMTYYIVVIFLSYEEMYNSDNRCDC